MSYYKKTLSGSRSTFMVVDRLGNIKWVNHTLYSLTPDLLCKHGFEALERVMVSTSKSHTARELDLVWQGTGETREWQISLKLGDVGQASFLARAYNIDKDNLILELIDETEINQQKVELKRKERELALITKIIEQRRTYIEQEAYYAIVLQTISQSAGADAAFIYASIDESHEPQLIAGFGESDQLIQSYLDLPFKPTKPYRVSVSRQSKKERGLFNTTLRLPLLLESEVIGWLYLTAKSDQAFRWHTIRLITRTSNVLTHLLALDILRWQQEYAKKISQAIFAHVKDGLLVIDEQGRVQEANGTAAELLGITSQSKRRGLSEYMQKDQQTNVKQFLDKLSSKNTARVRVNLPLHLSKTFELEGVRVATERRPQYICTIRDVTEWIENQAVLEAKALKLEQLDKMKDDFISMVSHELRSPLTVIQGHLSLWKRNLKTVDQNSLETINRGVMRLNNLVGDIIMASQMQYGEIPTIKDSFDLKLLVNNLLTELQPLSEEKKIKIQSLMSRQMIISDENRLSQILTNILMNGIKYCRRDDRISITAKETKQAITITIADTGPGISTEHLPHIFQRFYKIRQDSVGAGLGLYIVDQLVTRLGGQIRVQSSPKGTTFILRLPHSMKVGS